MDDSDNELFYCYGCMRQMEKGQTLCSSCGYDSSKPQNGENLLPEGTILAGKYLVGRMLGRGGFGVTYLGKDLILGVIVAIKEYFPMGISTRSQRTGTVAEITSSQENNSFTKGLNAFRSEAMNLARFDNPNIVRVRDYIQENGTAYIIMNFVSGRDLNNELIQCGGRIPWERALALFNPLIQELDVLHREHLIHRDIKPGNIKVVPADKGLPERLVLMDFGAARGFVSEAVTGTYTAMVSPGYAPIEQYSSRTRQGPFTDVYGLCATMYHAISGEVPPPVTDISTGAVSIKPFREFGLEVPEQVESAILRGLALKPAKRTQSMKELYEDLNGVRSDADPAEIPEQFSEKVQPVPQEESVGELVLTEQCEQPVQTSKSSEAPEQTVLFEQNDSLPESAPESDSPVNFTEIRTGNFNDVLPATELLDGDDIHREIPRTTVNPQPPKPRQKKKAWIPAAIAGAMAVLAGIFFLIHSKQGSTPGQSQQVEIRQTQTVSADEAEDAGTASPAIRAVRRHATSTPSGAQTSVPTVSPTRTPFPTTAPTRTPVPTTARTPVPTTAPTAVSDPVVLYLTGKAAYDRGDYTEALKNLVPAAQSGNPDAQYYLGMMYENGQGVAQSYTMAARYYQMSADQGNAKSQVNLGMMYEDGRGVEQSPAMAIRYYKPAADQGDPEGQYRLGLMYENGKGVVQSNEMAIRYYQLAANQGHEEAKANLANLQQKQPGSSGETVQSAPVSGEVKIGDIITFGHYEQDNNLNNGTEPIEWVVLAVQNNRALVFSRYALDAKPYNEKSGDTTWETSALRIWLNGQFSAEAFSAAEREQIVTVVNTTPNNTAYGTKGGNDTRDRVFLLSREEAARFLSSDEQRQLYYTDYAIAAAKASSFYKGNNLWWLRTPGGSQGAALIVMENGSFGSYGVIVEDSCIFVRPALWIDLSSGTVQAAEIPEADVSPDFVDVKAGDVITFGHYEQDNDLSNGPEAIEWQVLTVDSGQALLISLYGLDAVKYNETRDSVTWETCTLRPWLNGTFFSTAFSSAEAERIAVTTVHTPMFRSIDGGNDTQDRLFLLSVSEMNAYFGSADSLMLTATDYAAGNGAAVNVNNGNTWWWLRTPWGEVTESAVSYEGSLWSVGLWVDMDFVTVRPAFWLKL